MTEPKIIGVRWYDNKLLFSFLGLPTLIKYTKPVIPGIEFDTFLHFEPSANITEYANNGIGQQMTELQKNACMNYIKQVDVPGFSYNPSQFNVYTGIKTKKEAEQHGLKLVYVPVTNELCKFNETNSTWENIHAIVCTEGKVFFNFINDYVTPITEENLTTCGTNIQNAGLIFTQSEWDVAAVTRQYSTDIFDFKTHSWIDNRSVEQELDLVQQHVNEYEALLLSGFELESQLNTDIVNIDDVSFNINKIKDDVNSDIDNSDITEYFNAMITSMSQYERNKYKVLHLKLTVNFYKKHCSTLEDTDKLITYIKKEIKRYKYEHALIG